MTVASAPGDCSYCMQSVLDQHPDFCGSACRATRTEFFCLLIDRPYLAHPILAKPEIAWRSHVIKHAGVRVWGSPTLETLAAGMPASQVKPIFSDVTLISPYTTLFRWQGGK